MFLSRMFHFIGLREIPRRYSYYPGNDTFVNMGSTKYNNYTGCRDLARVNYSGNWLRTSQ